MGIDMNRVPHDLIINVNGPIELDQKVRRMLRSLDIVPTEQRVQKLTHALCVAFESLHGRSNLTAWRITKEWDDKHACTMVWVLLQDGPLSMTKTRLRSWEQGQPKPKPKTKSRIQNQIQNRIGLLQNN